MVRDGPPVSGVPKGLLGFVEGLMWPIRSAWWFDPVRKALHMTIPALPGKDGNALLQGRFRTP